MGKVFERLKDYYEEDEKIFCTTKFEIDTGITVLVGCNGTGKSTCLKIIKRQLDKEDINYYSYDNKTDGRWMRDKAIQAEDYTYVAKSMYSSEGEEIMLNLTRVIGSVGQYVRKNKDQRELWLLFDAIDSGFSIDNIIEFKNVLKMILQDNAEKDIYIIISANSFEMAVGENCLDAQRGVYRHFSSYEAYKNFILKSFKTKCKLRGWENKEGA